MNRIKKLVIGLGAGVVALGLLSGCGNQQASQNNNQQQSQQQNKNNNGNNGAPSQVAKNGKTNMENNEEHKFNTTKVPKLTYKPLNGYSGTTQSEYIDYFNSPDDAYRAYKTDNVKGEGVPKSAGTLDGNTELKILGEYKQGNKTVAYKVIKEPSSLNEQFDKHAKKDDHKVIYIGFSKKIGLGITSPSGKSNSIFS